MEMSEATTKTQDTEQTEGHAKEPAESLVIVDTNMATITINDPPGTSKQTAFTTATARPALAFNWGLGRQSNQPTFRGSQRPAGGGGGSSGGDGGGGFPHNLPPNDPDAPGGVLGGAPAIPNATDKFIGVLPQVFMGD